MGSSVDNQVAWDRFDGVGRSTYNPCLLYTSDAADDLLCVDLGGRPNPDMVVVMMTAYSSSEMAGESTKGGAPEYLAKPFTTRQLRKVMEKALSKKRWFDQNRQLREHYRHEAALERSGQMGEVYDSVEEASKSDANVLVCGDIGSGKELFSRMIHYRSRRAEGRFIAIDCATVPPVLLERQVLGDIGGAFARPDHDKKGLFELAAGGTLFLGEVSGMSMQTQSKILRALEVRKIGRVDSEKGFQADARIISSTSRDLDEDVKRGAFRGDLCLRLNTLRIEIPPLREHSEDIPTLAYDFLKKFSQRHNKEVDNISGEAMGFLVNYPWPGNVRELENAIDRAVILADDRTIRRGDFARWLSPAGVPGVRLPACKGAEEEIPSLEEMKMRYIKRVMALCGGNKRKAAKILRITPVTIWRKLGCNE